MSSASPRFSLTNWYLTSTAREKRRLGICILVVCVVLLMAQGFIPDREAVKTALQVDFENYVDQYEQKLLQANESEIITPRIKLTIYTGMDTGSRQVLVDPKDGNGANQKVARILSLAREAEIFAVNRPSIISGEGVTITIDDGTKKFETNLNRSDITNNIKAESLLKLLTIHGKPVI